MNLTHLQLQEGEHEFSREILDERAKKAESWHQKAASRAPLIRPMQPITCATFAQDVIEGRAKATEFHEHKHQPMIFGPASLVGGRLASEREMMAARVFQPGHRYVVLFKKLLAQGWHSWLYIIGGYTENKRLVWCFLLQFLLKRLVLS